MDLLQLIRKRLCDLNLTGTEVGTRVFGNSRALLQILAQNQSLSFKAFVVLVEELGVSKDPDVLRTWISALLLHKSPPGMVRLLRMAGLTTDEDDADADVAGPALAAVLGAGWRQFSRVPAAGRLRQRILGVLSKSSAPINVTAIAAAIGVRYAEVSSPIRWLQQNGYVMGVRSKERMGSLAFGYHQGVAMRWKITERGQTALAQAVKADSEANDELDSPPDLLGAQL